MVVYVNGRNEIKDVGTTTNESLTPIDLDGISHPFDDMSVDEICCYKVRINERGNAVVQPYIAKDLRDRIGRLGKENEELKKANMSTQAQVDYVTMMSDIEM